jgi:hypothetical protein
MLKEGLRIPKTAAHRRQLLARESLLIAAVIFIGLLLQAGGHRSSVLVLDCALIAVGFIGILIMVFSRVRTGRWWFIGVSAVGSVAGIAQLFWSSGFAIGFVIIIAALLIGDAIANILILGLQAWRGERSRG